MLLLAPGVALAAANKPTIEYPKVGASSNIRVNPTLFFSPFTDATDPDATQGDFEAEVATTNGFDASVVWRSRPGSGAGMAVSVDARSGTFQNALACRTQLDFGADYFARVRQKGKSTAFGPFSDVVSFKTVKYDGRKLYLSPTGADTGTCQNAAAPCRSLAFAIGRAAGGDQILLSPGIYPTSAGQLTFNDLPDRIWIRGADPSNRPVIKANYPTTGQSIFATLNAGNDVIFQDIVFEGQNNCCPTASQNRYTMLFRSAPQRFSWVNVAFRKGMNISGNLTGGVAGTTDTLISGCEFNGQPTDGVIPAYGDPGRTVTGYSDYFASFLTVRNSTFDQNTEHLHLVAQDRLLMEDVSLTRGVNHPFRSEGFNKNWTLRRILFGDGLEGLSIAAGSAAAGIGASSIQNFVLEGSTFMHSLTLSDNGNAPGTIGTLVLRDNIFTGDGSPEWWVADCITFCPGGNIIDLTTDRIDIDRNIYFDPDPFRLLFIFDGVSYTRRGTPNNYDAWRQRGFDANSPFALYNGNLKDSVDPKLTTVPLSDPSIQADPTPLAGSPVIDAGDPAYRVPEGGAPRVDIGVEDFLQAPVISSSLPLLGETCAVEGSNPITFTLTDAQGDIAAGSVSVSVDGAPVVPGTSGSGSSLTVSVPFPAVPSAANVVTVDVSAADTAGHTTTTSFCFTIAPPAPANVRLP
jgi:hypothetical protein